MSEQNAPSKEFLKRKLALERIRLNPEYTFGTEETVHTENLMDAFIARGKELNIELKKAEVKSPSDGARGIFATKPLVKNEIIIKIPLSTMLEIEPNKQAFNFKKSFEKPTLIENTIINNPDSLLSKLYIQSLPKSFSNSIFYFNEQFLEHTALGRFIHLNTVWLKNIYLQQSEEDKQSTSFDEFLWLCLITNSRQFTIQGKTYLAPIADLLNHCEIRHNCRFYFNVTEQQLHFVTTQKIKAGDEIMTLYEENMDTISSIMGYNMFPNKRIRIKRPAVHYFLGQGLYRIEKSKGMSLSQIVIDLYRMGAKRDDKNNLVQSKQSVHNVLQYVKSDLVTQIQNRISFKKICIEQAQSEWERKIVGYIFDLEKTLYEELLQLVIALMQIQVQPNRFKQFDAHIKSEINLFKQELKKQLFDIG